MVLCKLKFKGNYYRYAPYVTVGERGEVRQHIHDTTEEKTCIPEIVLTSAMVYKYHSWYLRFIFHVPLVFYQRLSWWGFFK